MKKLIIAALIAFGTPLTALQADDASVWCLAKNIYHEARGEPTKGKLAVAKVTLNRVDSSLFGDTVCEVVYQYKQFSWTSNPKLKVLDKAAWAESVEIAKRAINTRLPQFRFDALYFHSTAVTPKWNKTKTKVAKIGNHVFYK